MPDEKSKKEKVNPAARKDSPGDQQEGEHRSTASSAAERQRQSVDPPKGYQKTRLDPRDQGGIAE